MSIFGKYNRSYNIIVGGQGSKLVKYHTLITTKGIYDIKNKTKKI